MATEYLSRLFSMTEVEATEMDPDILWDRVVSIEYIGYEHVYDIEVEGTHNFIGGNAVPREDGTSFYGGIFAHNTYISKRAGELEYIFPAEMAERVRMLERNILGLIKDVPKRVTIEIPQERCPMPMMNVSFEGAASGSRFLMSNELVDIFIYHGIDKIVIEPGGSINLFLIVAHLGGLRENGVKLGEREGFVSGDKVLYIRKGKALYINSKPSIKPVRLWRVRFEETGFSPSEMFIVERLMKARVSLEKGSLSEAKILLDEVRERLGRRMREGLIDEYKGLIGRLNSAYGKKIRELHELKRRNRFAEAVRVVMELYTGFKETVELKEAISSLRSHLPVVFIFLIRIDKTKAGETAETLKDILLSLGFDSPFKFLEHTGEIGYVGQAKVYLGRVVTDSYYNNFGIVERVIQELGYLEWDRGTFYSLARDLGIELDSIEFNALERLREKISELRKKRTDRILETAVKELGFEDIQVFTRIFGRLKGFHQFIKKVIEEAFALKGRYRPFVCEYLGVTSDYLDRKLREYGIEVDKIKHNEADRLQKALERKAARKTELYNMDSVIKGLGYPDFKTFWDVYGGDTDVEEVIRRFFMRVLVRFGGNISYCAEVSHIPYDSFRYLVRALDIKVDKLSYNEAGRLREELDTMRKAEIREKGPLDKIDAGSVERFNLTTALKAIGWASFHDFVMMHGRDSEVRRVLKKTFEDAIGTANGNHELTARLLGISRSTLLKWIRVLGLSIQSTGDSEIAIAERLGQALRDLPEGQNERLDLASKALGFGQDPHHSLRTFIVKHGREPELRRVIRETIIRALIGQGGNLTAAARRLGMIRMGLKKYIRKMGIDKDSLPYNELARFKSACEGYGGGIPNLNNIVKQMGYHDFKNFVRQNRADREVFKKYIIAIVKNALVLTNGNIALAADRLGVSRTYLYSLLKSELPGSRPTPVDDLREGMVLSSA